MATAKLKRKPRLSKIESYKAANFLMLGVFCARFPPREASIYNIYKHVYKAANTKEVQFRLKFCVVSLLIDTYAPAAAARRSGPININH